MQIIFQDPFGSLDPRMNAEDVIAEPLVIHERRAAQLGTFGWLNCYVRWDWMHPLRSASARVQRGAEATDWDCAGAGAASEIYCGG